MSTEIETNECEKCLKTFSTNNLRIVGKNNDEIVCETCFELHYAQCDDCEKFVLTETTREINNNNVCKLCEEENYSDCHDCEQTFSNDELHSVNDSEYDVCDNCLQSNYTKCSDCDDFYKNDELNIIDGDESLCDDCFGQSYTHCEGCGEAFSNNDINSFDLNDEHLELCNECKTDYLLKFIVDHIKVIPNTFPMKKSIKLASDCQRAINMSGEILPTIKSELKLLYIKMFRTEPHIPNTTKERNWNVKCINFDIIAKEIEDGSIPLIPNWYQKIFSTNLLQLLENKTSEYAENLKLSIYNNLKIPLSDKPDSYFILL